MKNNGVFSLGEALFLSKVTGLTRNEEVLKRHSRQGAFITFTGYSDKGRRLPLGVDVHSFLKYVLKNAIVNGLRGRTKETLSSGYFNNPTLDVAVNEILEDVDFNVIEEKRGFIEGNNKVLKSDFNLSQLDLKFGDLKELLKAREEVKMYSNFLWSSIYSHETKQWFENNGGKHVFKFNKKEYKVRDFDDFFELIDFLTNNGVKFYQEFGFQFKEKKLNDPKIIMEKLKRFNDLQKDVVKKEKEIEKLCIDNLKKVVPKGSFLSNQTKFLWVEIINFHLPKIQNEKDLKVYNLIVRKYIHHSLVEDEQMFEVLPSCYNVKGRIFNFSILHQNALMDRIMTAATAFKEVESLEGVDYSSYYDLLKIKLSSNQYINF